MVGWTPGGTVVSASEKVPRPVQASSPTKTSAPMPEASRPGSATRLRVAPAMPAASMMRKAPSSGEPSSVLIGGEAAGGRHDRHRHRRGVPLDQAHGQGRQPAADGDERRLGAEHRPEPERGERGEHDAGEVAAGRRAPTRSGSPRAGEWPAVPGR